MAHTLLAVVIHGMGSQSDLFHRPFTEKLLAELTDEERQQVRIVPIYYQDLLEGEQRAMWTRMVARSLGWAGLRDFLFFGFSDAATYQFRLSDPDSDYQQVHRRIRDRLDEAVAAWGAGSDGYNVIAFAHSLGGQVLSSYVWDAQKGRRIWEDTPASPDQRLARMERLVTFGCNIPLFLSGRSEAEPFDAPNADFEWHNYYDGDDVLGWPLRPISHGYDRFVVDHQINVGGWFCGRTPVSHTKYWENKGFVRAAAGHVRELL